MAQMQTGTTRHKSDSEGGHGSGSEEHAGMDPNRAYILLGIVLAVDLVVMFALTYAGVNAFDEIFLNLNRFYMAIIMVSAMAVIMVAAMWRMLRRPAVNIAILGVADVVFAGSFAMLRTETGVGNKQFLKSMIPHHSIAIHTCENADITDKEIIDLCGEIVDSQRREIDQMRDILQRLDQ